MSKTPDKTPICRRLFDSSDDVDYDDDESAAIREARRVELAEHQRKEVQRLSEKYEFNFEEEKPIENCKRWIWRKPEEHFDDSGGTPEATVANPVESLSEATVATPVESLSEATAAPSANPVESLTTQTTSNISITQTTVTDDFPSKKSPTSDKTEDGKKD